VYLYFKKVLLCSLDNNGAHHVLCVLRYKSEGRWFDSRWCHWNFSLTYSFQSHYGSGVDSASNWNEYQEHFLGVKAGVPKADNLTPSCAVVMKSGYLNFLELSGPLSACNRTDLPYHVLCGLQLTFLFTSIFWLKMIE